MEESVEHHCIGVTREGKVFGPNILKEVEEQIKAILES